MVCVHFVWSKKVSVETFSQFVIYILLIYSCLLSLSHTVTAKSIFEQHGNAMDEDEYKLFIHCFCRAFSWRFSVTIVIVNVCSRHFRKGFKTIFISDNIHCSASFLFICNECCCVIQTGSLWTYRSVHHVYAMRMRYTRLCFVLASWWVRKETWMADITCKYGDRLRKRERAAWLKHQQGVE